LKILIEQPYNLSKVQIILIKKKRYSPVYAKDAGCSAKAG